MYTRLLETPLKLNKSFFLFGPRGTGKTAWVKENFPESIYLDLLETDLYLDLLSQPSRLESFIPKNFENWVILDEVQRIPDLLNEVHRLIESKKIKFVLTGSSARSLRKKGVNLLAGRALTFSMYPLTSMELKNSFNLTESLEFGHLPAVFSEPDPKLYLAAYIKTYLREEVLQEGLTRNLGNFSRFLEVSSFSQGSLVNMSEIAREVGINRKVVESYFSILEDLLLAFYLPIFTKRSKRRLVSHPKFYFFDVGIFKAIRPKGPLDLPSEIQGVVLETLVIQEIRAVTDYFNLGYECFYWRTQSQLEVDLILYGEKGILAFEIKLSETLKNADLKGLKAFSEDYPEAKLYFLNLGKRREYHENIEVIPVTEFLQNLISILSPIIK
jgi:predicted AAA+ superfamily ATPase